MTTEHNPFVGDNDHGAAVPPTLAQTLESVTRHRDALYAEVLDLQTRVAVLTQERDRARRDACEFGAMLETDANPNYAPESGDFAKIAMRIAYAKGWDCWRDYEKENTNE